MSFGELQDLRKFYDEHVTFVWRSLRAFGVREANLKDAVQDVWSVVFRRLPDFDGSVSVRRWLFRICVRTARDYRRRAHTRWEVFDLQPLTQLTDGSLDASERIQKQENLAILERALEKIDPDQRAVFVRFELDEMTGDEIAKALRIPLRTVYSRLRLARAAFHGAVHALMIRNDRFADNRRRG